MEGAECWMVAIEVDTKASKMVCWTQQFGRLVNMK
jgi:hypothetical protein